MMILRLGNITLDAVLARRSSTIHIPEDDAIFLLVQEGEHVRQWFVTTPQNVGYLESRFGETWTQKDLVEEAIRTGQQFQRYGHIIHFG